MPECYDCGKEAPSMRQISWLDTDCGDEDNPHTPKSEINNPIPQEYEGKNLCSDCLEQYDGYVGA